MQKSTTHSSDDSAQSNFEVQWLSLLLLSCGYREDSKSEDRFLFQPQRTSAITHVLSRVWVDVKYTNRSSGAVLIILDVPQSYLWEY